jgi:cysteine desulfurase
MSKMVPAPESLPAGQAEARAVYLDCAATTPLDPRVREEMLHWLDREFGNPGSRTHAYGQAARQAVERARAQVAEVAGSRRNEVIFTSGATEANNLALLGLEAHGRRERRMHIVSTHIEHHAVLEPLRVLAGRGFEVTLVDPAPSGWVDAERITSEVRPDTLLVSVMQVNNETGVLQPIGEITEKLSGSDAFFHVDAAQGFGKEIVSLRHPRIDLVSLSGHKICGPKGVGALIARRRSGERLPLEPLAYGGGQEIGLRPGTLPAHLIAALGKASELARNESKERLAAAREMQAALLQGLGPLDPQINGDRDRLLPFILNVSFPGYDAETVIEAWAKLAAISDGAACTSQSYTCSHVLSAMRLDPERQDGAVRFSWCHLSQLPDTQRMVDVLRKTRG